MPETATPARPFTRSTVGLMVSDNVAAYMRFMELVTNFRPELMPEIVDVEEFREQCAGVTRGWLSYHDAIEAGEQMAGAFAGMEITYDDVVAIGERVMARYRIRATHAGPLFGVPATGRTIEWNGCDFVRVRNGRIVERWFLPDMFSIAAQVGLLATAG